MNSRVVKLENTTGSTTGYSWTGNSSRIVVFICTYFLLYYLIYNVLKRRISVFNWFKFIFTELIFN